MCTGRREELEGRVRASVGFDNIYIHEHLQTTKEELEAEMASAVAEFKRVGQDYDEGKLREQAFETLKVLPHPTPSLSLPLPREAHSERHVCWSHMSSDRNDQRQ